MSRMDKWSEQEQVYKSVLSGVESQKASSQRPRPTLVFNTRLSPGYLATLARYFIEKEGEYSVGPSQVIRMALEMLGDLLLKKYPELEFHSSHEVSEFLRRNGIVKGQNEQNSKRLVRYQALETLMEERSEQECKFDDLEMFRVIARNIVKSGETPSQEQLEMAQMTLLNGSLVPLEQLGGIQ